MPTENISSSLPGMGVTIQRYAGYYSAFGPVVNQPGVFPWRLYTRNRTWARQPLPHERTLPYTDETFRLQAGYFDFRVTFHPEGGSKPSTTTQYTGNGGRHSDEAWVKGHTMPSTANARYRVLGALQDAKWNAALFAAEADKTADLIFSTAKRLAAAYKALRSRKYARTLDLLSLKRPSGPRNEWLAYRYGWTPLLGDVASAAEAAASTLVEKPPRLRVVKRDAPIESTTIRTGYFPNVCVQAHSGMPSAIQYRTVQYSKQTAKAWLEVEARNTALMRLEQFGLANPAALAWELIPFSFVADWFVGIGDYLNAQTALLGMRVVDGGVSQLSERTSTGFATGTFKGYSWEYPSMSGLLPQATLSGRRYVRSRWDGSPPPIRVSAELNLKRIIDAAALIHAVFGPRK